MTMVCKICSHPDHKKIDKQIVTGGNLSEIARRYQLSYDSVWRHKRGCIPPAIARAAQKSGLNHGARLLEDLDDLIISARGILRKAEESNHPKVALMAIKETRSSIMSIAQISHKIWETQQKEAQTIVIEQQDNDIKRLYNEALKCLTVEERKEFRRIQVKMLSAQGSSLEPHHPDQEPEEDDTTVEDPEYDVELRVDPEDFSLRDVIRPRHPEKDPEHDHDRPPFRRTRRPQS